MNWFQSKLRPCFLSVSGHNWSIGKQNPPLFYSLCEQGLRLSGFALLPQKDIKVVNIVGFLELTIGMITEHRVSNDSQKTRSLLHFSFRRYLIMKSNQWGAIT